jgi:hypothetical protein
MSTTLGCPVFRRFSDASAARGARARREVSAGREAESVLVGGVAFRRIGNEGLKGKKDVRRYPPTLHSWSRFRGGVFREEV